MKSSSLKHLVGVPTSYIMKLIYILVPQYAQLYSYAFLIALCVVRVSPSRSRVADAGVEVHLVHLLEISDTLAKGETML